MDLKEKELEALRDQVHNLDLSDPADRARYEYWRQVYFAAAEKSKDWAYDDRGKSEVREGKPIKGKITVGIGFNMDRGKKARDEWDEAFKNEERPPDFDAVKAGKRRITHAQIKLLFDNAVEKRERGLRELYGSRWGKLRPNERLAIVSAYYTGSKTVDCNSKFYGHIRKYYETGDERYLNYAIVEIEKHSNPQRNTKIGAGIDNRRRAEGLLLRSMECPLYSKPGEPVCPKRPLTVKEGETVLPRAVDTWQRPSSAQDEEYYIWRTKGDERVRPLCRSHANRVFSWTNPMIVFKPGEATYCRCTAEPVPHLVTVVPSRVTSVKKDVQRVYTYTKDDFWALWQSLMRLREQTERLLHDREQYHSV